MAERVHTALVPKVEETLLGLPRHLLFDERVVRALSCLSAPARLSASLPLCYPPTWFVGSNVKCSSYHMHILMTQVTNALVHAFVELEKEWIAHVEALPDRQARVKKVRRHGWMCWIERAREWGGDLLARPGCCMACDGGTSADAACRAHPNPLIKQ